VQVQIFVREADAGARPSRPRLSYFRGDDLRARSASRSRVLEYAAWDVHSCVPGKTRDFLLLHSGAVTAGGSTALVAGPAEVGKSSIVAGLLASGFGYLSDELGAIDPVTGRAHPFPKRLALAPSTLDALPGLSDVRDAGEFEGRTTRSLRAEDLGAAVSDPAPIRWLVFPSMDRDGAPRLSPVPRAEAVRRMAELSFNLYRFDERGLVLLSRVAERAEAFALDGGTLAERVELLAERLT
jgi:hypothetical protein